MSDLKNIELIDIKFLDSALWIQSTKKQKITNWRINGWKINEKKIQYTIK